MDFIVALPESEGRKVILVAVDYFTNSFEQATHFPELAQIFLQEIFSLHWLPGLINTDRGAQVHCSFLNGISEAAIHLCPLVTIHRQMGDRKPKQNFRPYLGFQLFLLHKIGKASGRERV